MLMYVITSVMFIWG